MCSTIVQNNITCLTGSIVDLCHVWCGICKNETSTSATFTTHLQTKQPVYTNSTTSNKDDITNGITDNDIDHSVVIIVVVVLSVLVLIVIVIVLVWKRGSLCSAVEVNYSTDEQNSIADISTDEPISIADISTDEPTTVVTGKSDYGSKLTSFGPIYGNKDDISNVQSNNVSLVWDNRGDTEAESKC